MRDVCLVYHYLDEQLAIEFSDSFATAGLEVGQPLRLAPRHGMRTLALIDGRLREARFVVVLVTHELLRDGMPMRKELDGIARRRNVLAVLRGVDERDVAAHSHAFAMACLFETDGNGLVRIIRAGEDEWGDA